MDPWHRDTVLRAYFVGKNWEENPEFRLKRRLVLNPPQELSRFALIIEDEWEVTPGQAKEGRGDLVFADGLGEYAVVEVKYLNHERTGRAARQARKERREHVQEQAKKYARAYCNRLHDPSATAVHAFSATPEGIQWQVTFRRSDWWKEWEEDQDAAFEFP